MNTYVTGSTIRQLRETKGLTQAELAGTLSVSAKTISKWEIATEYLALDEHEHLVGMTNLRHRLNDYLLTYGGHIGYSVRPSERQNGYATQMLRLTLEKAKERDIEKVRICCDHYNVASAKTIRANGGVLEDEQFDSSDGTLTQRYWIQNK